MIFGKTKLELKVGVFVFIAFFLLVVFVLSIGGFKTWTSGYKVSFIFNFVNGAKLGAPVRFAGVDVGEIKEMKFFYAPEESKTKVEMVCWLKKEIRVPLDSTIWVNTLGLLGEKYIEIMPGKDYTACLAAGGSMEGVDPIPMHEIFRSGKGIVEDLGQTLDQIKSGQGTIGKLLYDDTIYKELEALVMDIRQHPWKLFFRTKEKPAKK